MFIYKSLSPTSQAACECIQAAICRDRSSGGDKGTGKFAAHHEVALAAFNRLLASKPGGMDEAISWLADLHACFERIVPSRNPTHRRADVIEVLRRLLVEADIRWRDLPAEEKAKATCDVASRNRRMSRAELRENRKKLRPIGSHRTKYQKQHMALKRSDADPVAKRIAEFQAERDLFQAEIARRKSSAAAAAASSE